MRLFILFCTFCLEFSITSTSRILVVAPSVSKSHFDVFKPLLMALAARDHELFVISSYPQPSSIPNYKDISIQGFKTVYSNNIPLSLYNTVPANLVEKLNILYREISKDERLFYHPRVQELLKSDDSFDLVITEMWNTDLFLGFGHWFKAPVVVVSSSNLYPWFYARFGNPNNPSYNPNIFFAKMGHLNFLERLTNTLQVIISNIAYDWYYNSLSENIARRVFGNSIPPLDTLARNTSLVLVNSHHTLHGAQPLSPQIVQIGGIHVLEPKPLPKELNDWLSESHQGVIYFSFGSIVRAASLPTDKVKSFQQAFGKLTQRVLWKWEDDELAGSPSNVKIMSWIPQRDVLAHPNVRVFISHCGLLGVQEAVVSGVPILGIPFFSDQENNMAALVKQGTAVHVDYNNISETSLSWALDRLINDKSFSRNAKLLSERFLDRPQTPLETAVYWTEYVIKHGGAHHLKTGAANLSFYQYYLLDVLTVCFLACGLTLTVLYFTATYFMRILYRRIIYKNKTD